MRSMWPAALICQLSPRACGVPATTQPALRRLWAGWLTTDSAVQPSFWSHSSSSPADQGGGFGGCAKGQGPGRGRH
eukprot:15466227-Alexandrium_andersonii.AAC.1